MIITTKFNWKQLNNNCQQFSQFYSNIKHNICNTSNTGHVLVKNMNSSSPVYSKSGLREKA